LTDTSFDKEINHNFVYRIYVKKDKYQTSYSNEKQLTYTSLTLNKPKDLIATSEELTGIHLEWIDKSIYEESYKVEKDDGNGFSEIASLPSNSVGYFDAISGLSDPPLQLTYRVKAVNSSKESEWNTIYIIYAGLGSPANLIVTDTYSLNFTIEWGDSSSIETGYSIERAKDFGEFVELAVVEADSTAFSDKLELLGTYSYRVRTIKDNYSSAYSNEVNYEFNSYSAPMDSLVAYFPFNGNANDQSGNGNDGIVSGSTLINDRFNNENSAYSFDGIDDYINIGNDVKPDFPITISYWLKVSENTQFGNIFRSDYVNDVSYSYGFTLSFRGDGSLATHIYNGFSDLNNRRSTYSELGLIESDQWYNFTTIFHSHNNAELYLDGVQLNTTMEGLGSGMLYSSSNGGIGDRSGDNFFNGVLDDIRVYNRALSIDEVNLLYKENSE
jgi:hypothetical protein